jgi:hypothetical protein
MASVTSSDTPTPDGRRLPTRVSKACERCRRNKSRVSTLLVFHLFYCGIVVYPTKQQISAIHFVRAHSVLERMSNAPSPLSTCPLAAAHRKGNGRGLIPVMILSLRSKGLALMRLLGLRLSFIRRILCIPMMALGLLEKPILTSQWMQRADGKV